MNQNNLENPKIYANMAKIMGDVAVISKDRKNQAQGYSFRGIDDVYYALHNIMAEQKVFMTSEIVDVSREERTTKNGGLMIYTTLKITFRFYAEDGSFVITQTIGEAMDSGDKSTNKAMSVAQKYALLQAFLIPSREEKDVEYSNPQPAPRTQQRTSEILADAGEKGALKNWLRAECFTDVEREKTLALIEAKTLTSTQAKSYAVKIASKIISHYLPDEAVENIKETLQKMSYSEISKKIASVANANNAK